LFFERKGKERRGEERRIERWRMVAARKRSGGGGQIKDESLRRE
jgi:hypothetical protein